MSKGFKKITFPFPLPPSIIYFISIMYTVDKNSDMLTEITVVVQELRLKKECTTVMVM